ncbi:FGGY-family carbohydrate kinase [Pleomorphomonas sp. JP5]|uniref:xylulokinase n=1 Tax=Pleomorphomonas sp. JP5 TaxID=2942998 RepID=UPI002043F4E1|nr:FGGY family carbohydrate kinase [Pleomorphomonas sp. JP5]MCM5559239.1 FGGY family carbohydrate kinase [Pleomorphomonas sp. JP5]
MSFILTIDIGTSSLKAVLFDAELSVVAQSKQEYPTSYPKIGWAEQDPDHWSHALTRAVAGILSQTHLHPEAISGIGVDGMSSLMLPVDREGNALSNGLIWLDRRAQEQSDLVNRQYGNALLSISGNRSDPSNFGSKAMWLRDQRRDVYDACASLLHCSSFLVRQLTGVFVMNRSEAALSQLCDVRTGAYSDELIEASGIDRQKLPEIADCKDVVGRVTAAAAQRFGLAAGTPVIAGAMDNVAATIGLGLRNDGDAYIAAGTATNVGVLVDTPPLDGHGLTYHAGIEGKWLVNGSVDYGSAGLLWFRNLLGESSFETLCAEAENVERGQHPLVFLPYMTGQRAPLWNEALSGVLLGVTPGTDRRHLARMFMESTALGARHVFQKLREKRPSSAALTGGITHNPFWTGIFADATGMSLTPSRQTEVGNLGLAILTGLGIGTFRSPDEAFSLLPVDCSHEPDPGSRDYYDDLFALFDAAYESNRSVLAQLDEIRRKYGVE